MQVAVAAECLEVVELAGPALGNGHDVIDLEGVSRATPPALMLIALQNGTPNRRRDITRSG